MKKLHERVKMAKYLIALENSQFDSVGDYKNELFEQVSFNL